MSKYKAGDKVVMEIGECYSNNKYYGIYNENGFGYFTLTENIDNCADPLSEYTEKLEKKNENKQKRIEKLVEKLHNQRDEINMLLEDKAELKANYEALSDALEGFRKRVDDMCDTARDAGQQEAWKLAQKIYCMTVDGGFKPRELIEIFGTVPASSILRLNTYTEAATKVAEWERQKEEICVGDEVELSNGVKFFVTHYCDGYANGIESSGRCFYVFLGQDGKKTGRHLDIAAMLAQIGGDQNDNR